MQCKCSLHIFISIRQNTPRKYSTREGRAEQQRDPIENGMCVIKTRTVYIVMLVYLWLEIYRRNIGVQFANGKQMCASSVLLLFVLKIAKFFEHIVFHIKSFQEVCI